MDFRIGITLVDVIDEKDLKVLGPGLFERVYEVCFFYNLCGIVPWWLKY